MKLLIYLNQLVDFSNENFQIFRTGKNLDPETGVIQTVTYDFHGGRFSIQWGKWKKLILIFLSIDILIVPV